MDALTAYIEKAVVNDLIAIIERRYTNLFSTSKTCIV